MTTAGKVFAPPPILLEHSTRFKKFVLFYFVNFFQNVKMYQEENTGGPLAISRRRFRLVCLVGNCNSRFGVSVMQRAAGLELACPDPATKTCLC